MKTHLVFGTITLIMLMIVLGRQHTVKPFNFADTEAEARRLSRQPFRLVPDSRVPEALTKLTAAQLKEIRWRDDKTLWRDKAVPFKVKFFHPGGPELDHSVNVNVVTNHSIDQVRYSPDFFQYPPDLFSTPLTSDVGYAGFRIHYPLQALKSQDDIDKIGEVAVFLGGDHFRGIGDGQVYGTSARAILAPDVNADEDRWEAAHFTRFWLDEPTQANAKSMRIYALLEAESLTGAYEFWIEPGETTSMKVRATLYFRGTPKPIIVAPLVSMYWFGENTSNTFGDWRPEVHDADGLSLETSAGDWIWHPLSYVASTRERVFPETNPKGFGLFQRDREWEHYKDLDAQFQNRASAWVECVGDWGKGDVVLVERTNQKDPVDNVFAGWRPAKLPEMEQPLKIEYIIHWLRDDPQRPPLARCLFTSVDRQDSPMERNIILEFKGGKLNDEEPPDARITATAGAVIEQKEIQKNDQGGSWRISFVVKRAPGAPSDIDMQCTLFQKGKAVSETWDYEWPR